MNAEDLLILGAIGVGIYYVMNQSTAATAASALPAPISPAVPQTPAINVQPSTVPLSNPIASAASAASPFAPTPGPAPAPPVPVMAIPPPPVGVMQSYPVTSGPAPGPASGPSPSPYSQPSPMASGPIPPSPTVQPGVITTAPAPVPSILVVSPSAPTPYIPPPPAPVYNPTFSYQLSRPGTTLYPGDTWSISITGAKPGSTVAMMLSQNGGNAANNMMGSVNSGGSFSYTGSVSNGMDGQWTQLWFVNGSMIGSMGFTVLDPVVNAAPPVTTYNIHTPNTPIGTAAAPRTGQLIIGGVAYRTSPLYI